MFLEGYENVMKNFFEAIRKNRKTKIIAQENPEIVVPKSDVNELCENQNDLRETVQLPSGE
jgi:hypothetical protein